jgi:TRAP-type C4-dicarboxylate transport system permease small subunit
LNFGKRLDALLGVVGAVVLFGMMMLTFVDVIMRYGFNASLRGAFEITELMMVILIYAGLPIVSRNDLHVTTDLIDRVLSQRVRRALDTVMHSICALVLFGAAWLVWLKAVRTAQLRDTTAALQIGLAPYVYLMCVLIFITAVIHLVKVFLVPRASAPSAGSAT